ncbi:MAG: hypothetical protein B6D61_12945 [Bacteroidetes bacterium 4484_249]|nr:MAG: hypothetical protein B6D61_12945 [Bacteroidetes bacterium 4484_249]
MNLKLSLIISVFALWPCMSIARQDSVSTIKEKDPEILVGEFARNDLQKGNFGDHFFYEYRKYIPEISVLDYLKNKIYNYDITIVLATWCYDSQEQVPRFFKILDNINYNTNYLKIICVDKSKSAGEIDISGLYIERVPTFIFYENNIEKGRIIETPESTLEKDIYNILYN